MLSSITNSLRLTGLASLLFLSAPVKAETGDAMAERMLERLGGKAVWASLKNTINGSVQHRVTAPNEVYSVITMDFERPRFRIDTIAEDINLVRVINGEASWRISWSGLVEDLPASSFSADMLWYQAHIYRTLHRIAKGDPALTYKVGTNKYATDNDTNDTNLLEVYVNDQRLIWFRLTSEAEPYAFGFWDDDLGSLCGPWSVAHQGVRHPAWVSSHDGSWRAAIRALDFNVPLHDSAFSRPMVVESNTGR